jgi:hypothetical protein
MALAVPAPIVISRWRCAPIAATGNPGWIFRHGLPCPDTKRTEKREQVLYQGMAGRAGAYRNRQMALRSDCSNGQPWLVFVVANIARRSGHKQGLKPGLYVIFRHG